MLERVSGMIINQRCSLDSSRVDLHQPWIYVIGGYPDRSVGRPWPTYNGSILVNGYGASIESSSLNNLPLLDAISSLSSSGGTSSGHYTQVKNAGFLCVYFW